MSGRLFPHVTYQAECSASAPGGAAAVDTVVSGGELKTVAPATAAGQAAAGQAAVRQRMPSKRLVQVRFEDGGIHGVSVPYVMLELSNGDRLLRYSVDPDYEAALGCLELNGEYTGSSVVASDKSEPAAVRSEFIAARGRERTQLEWARSGVITAEMEYVALRESAAGLLFPHEHRAGQPDRSGQAARTDRAGAVAYSSSLQQGRFDEAAGVVFLKREHMACTPEMVRSEIAAGRAVIPACHNHPESAPMIIGKRFLTKVNANIGTSSLSSGFADEIAKLKQSLRFGADTVMDLSTGISDLSGLRRAIVRNSAVPVGTVPVYEALDRVKGDVNKLSWEVFRQVVTEQAQQGVDYFTIHAGLLKDTLPYAARRVMGIVSRGGAVMAAHMMAHDCENMAYEHFDELMEICREYDVALSLGDGMRPGGICDSCDQAQYLELEHLGVLSRRCFEHGVQCFIEGPGHVALHRIAENQQLQSQWCHDAPFYTLGPLVSDIGAGFDHLTSAIGGTVIGSEGASMLCYVTPSEHLALPQSDDVRNGMIAHKLAAHAADLARCIATEPNIRSHATDPDYPCSGPGEGLANAQTGEVRPYNNAYNLDYAMSLARAEFRWRDQFALSFDEKHAYEVWKAEMGEDECDHNPSYCSMCGPRFCPMRLNRRLAARFAAEG